MLFLGGHIGQSWSQLVAGEVSDLNINGAHPFFGPMASNQELAIRRGKREMHHLLTGWLRRR